MLRHLCRFNRKKKKTSSARPEQNEESRHTVITQCSSQETQTLLTAGQIARLRWLSCVSMYSKRIRGTGEENNKRKEGSEHTRVDIRPLRIQIYTKPPLKLLLDTLLGDSHQVSRSQNLTDLSEQSLVRRQMTRLIRAQICIYMAAHHFRRRDRKTRARGSQQGQIELRGRAR